MLYYGLEKMVAAGIRDIMIVTGSEHMGSLVQTLGSGRDFGCSLTYRVQDEAGGIAQALGLARGFAYGERMAVLLGDNLFEDPFTPLVGEYQHQDRGARVVLKLTLDLHRFGIAVLDRTGKLRELVEKPTLEELARLRDHLEYTDFLAVTGLYFYDQRVFQIIDHLKPSQRNELEITDVNRAYLEWGELSYSVVNGWWTDAGTHDSLYIANQLVREHPPK
jgi:glucose-1-phosphate thymidylyltransferase